MLLGCQVPRFVSNCSGLGQVKPIFIIFKILGVIYRFMIEEEGQAWTKKQSTKLKRVNLRVSMKSYKHFMMLGTETRQKNGEYQDPCAGDSGGPLMYQDRSSGRWMLIGHSRRALLRKLICQKKPFQTI